MAHKNCKFGVALDKWNGQNKNGVVRVFCLELGHRCFCTDMKCNGSRS